MYVSDPFATFQITRQVRPDAPTYRVFDSFTRRIFYTAVVYTCA